MLYAPQKVWRMSRVVGVKGENSGVYIKVHEHVRDPLTFTLKNTENESYNRKPEKTRMECTQRYMTERFIRSFRIR